MEHLRGGDDGCDSAGHHRNIVVGAAEWCCLDRGVAEAAENVVGVALISLLDRGRESARGGKSRKEIRSQQ